MTNNQIQKETSNLILEISLLEERLKSLKSKLKRTRDKCNHEEREAKELNIGVKTYVRNECVICRKVWNT